jgi:flagellar biosynthetic protein FlhB
MADVPKEERTEQPTSKRLKDARDKGNVPVSQEMLSAVTLIVLTAITALKGPSVARWAMDEIRQGFSCDQHLNMSNPHIFLSYMNTKIVDCFFIMTPFFLALMISGVATCLVINGRTLTFSPKALKLKFDTINPINGLKTMFSASSLVKLILSVIKIIFVSLIVYSYLRDKLNSLATFQWVSSEQMLGAISGLILGVLKRLCLAIFIIGIIDLIYQKWKFIEKLKMTKKEVRDEARDADTPPEVKQRIRSKQYEAFMRRMLQEVPKANVVLVNPTHVAVALRYDPEIMNAPVVVAKGGDHLCEKIKDIARAYGVPIIRRPALARTLFSTIELGGIVPDELFVAVAEILALVYRLRQSRIYS